MATRTLIRVPPESRRGAIVTITTLIGHAMDTGLRVDAEGRRVPRDIITRFECRLDGALVFSADLFVAVAANPYIAFAIRAERSSTLTFTWTGDHGFRHVETVPLTVAG